MAMSRQLSLMVAAIAVSCLSITGCHALAPSALHKQGRGGFVGSFAGAAFQPKNLELPKFEIAPIKLELPKPSAKGVCNFLAGGVAGSVAAAITCPLEVIKTNLQSRAAAGLGLGPLSMATSIIQQQGIKGLYRGLGTTVVGIMPTRSTYFWAYGASKGALSPVLGDGPATHVAAAVCAGSLSQTVTCPLWMVKTRMQLTGGKLGETVSTILKDEGFKGLYRGLGASYWGLTESCMQFLIYEKLKAGFTESAEAKGKKGLSHWEYLGAAGGSKLVAAALTYPHEVVRTRMREASGGRYKSMIQSIKLIAREEGRAGLYGGLGPHLMRVVPNTAIMFLSYEILSKEVPRLIEDGTFARIGESIQSMARPEALAGAAAVGAGAVLSQMRNQASRLAVA
jgi:solute carrier family 25 protein 33/36